MQQLCLVVALVIGLTTPAWADFEDSKMAYDRGDYAMALKELRRLAEGDSVGAQYNLGIMCERGEGVNQDSNEATKWFRKAAEKGHTDAQYILGVRYELGQGVPQDHAEAAKWFSKAAEKGDAEA